MRYNLAVVCQCRHFIIILSLLSENGAPGPSSEVKHVARDDVITLQDIDIKEREVGDGNKEKFTEIEMTAIPSGEVRWKE